MIVYPENVRRDLHAMAACSECTNYGLITQGLGHLEKLGYPVRDTWDAVRRELTPRYTAHLAEKHGAWQAWHKAEMDRRVAALRER